MQVNRASNSCAQIFYTELDVKKYFQRGNFADLAGRPLSKDLLIYIANLKQSAGNTLNDLKSSIYVRFLQQAVDGDANAWTHRLTLPVLQVSGLHNGHALSYALRV